MAAISSIDIKMEGPREFSFLKWEGGNLGAISAMNFRDGGSCGPFLFSKYRPFCYIRAWQTTELAVEITYGISQYSGDTRCCAQEPNAFICTNEARRSCPSSTAGSVLRTSWVRFWTLMNLSQEQATPGLAVELED